MGAKIGRWQLDNFEQKQNEDDEEDEADASSAVVTESWSHAITAEAEHKDQNDQKNKHYLFSPYGEDSPDVWCDAYFVANAIKNDFSAGLPVGCNFLYRPRHHTSLGGAFGRKWPTSSACG